MPIVGHQKIIKAQDKTEQKQSKRSRRAPTQEEDLAFPA